MLTEDDEPRAKTPLLATPPLDRLGIDELQTYIAALRAEILRVESEIARKQHVRNAADRFFRTP